MAIGVPSGVATKAIPHSRTKSYRIAWLITIAIIGLLYFWIIGIGARGERFAWSVSQIGYYNLLGRAFAHGKLYLPVDPAPELLALSDPWDERANQQYAWQDAVLYHKHYYLYHGAAPAILLFTPWYVLTKHDLPENFAAFLLCFGGYLLLAELFLQLISSLSIRCPLALFSILLVVLGTGTSVPFLLHRVEVYEIAIASGFFCLAAACYFFLKRLRVSRRVELWAGLSGLAVGFAAASRPHLGLAAAPLIGVLVLLPDPPGRISNRFLRRDVLAFSTGFTICCLGIVLYNYARFGEPLEFGLRYQLGGATYRNLHLSWVNVVPGLYYLLLCPPDLVGEFPFFRLALRQPFDGSLLLPYRYFIEPIAGVLALCPITLLAPVVLAWRKRFENCLTVALLLPALLIYAGSCILFVALTGLSSQRFEVDFLPFMLLVSCVAGAAVVSDLRNWPRILATIVITAGVLYCLAANLALAIQGPYDQFVQANPRSYVNLSRWFSPVAHYRLLLNPRVQVAASFRFGYPCSAHREPLASMGEFGSRYSVSSECLGGSRLRLLSEASLAPSDTRIVEVPFRSSGWNRLELDFTPEKLLMIVSWNGNIVLRHGLRYLVTAPSQIHFGSDPSLGNKNAFDGRIRAGRSVIIESTHPDY